jgi:hypothetical protein
VAVAVAADNLVLTLLEMEKPVVLAVVAVETYRLLYMLAAQVLLGKVTMAEVGFTTVGFI